MSSAEVGAPLAVAPKMLLSRTCKAVLATVSVALATALLFQSRMWLPTARGMLHPAQKMAAKQRNQTAAWAEKILATASRRMQGAGEICDADLPAGTLQHTLITLDDAEIAAQNVYTRVTVGGSMRDGAPGTWKAVDGRVNVEGTAATEMWNFNGGLYTGAPLSDAFQWSDFEALASTVLPGAYEGGFLVIVLESGGTFTQADLLGPWAQAEDNGCTLVVFNTHDDVTLDRSPDGRQFGPSVLAPFSRVTLRRNAGFIDGFLVARELCGDVRGSGHLQMHGDGYRGPLECPCPSSSSRSPTRPRRP